LGEVGGEHTGYKHSEPHDEVVQLDNCIYYFCDTGHILAWSSPRRINNKNYNSP